MIGNRTQSLDQGLQRNIIQEITAMLSKDRPEFSKAFTLIKENRIFSLRVFDFFLLRLGKYERKRSRELTNIKTQLNSESGFSNNVTIALDILNLAKENKDRIDSVFLLRLYVHTLHVILMSKNLDIEMSLRLYSEAMDIELYQSYEKQSEDNDKLVKEYRDERVQIISSILQIYANHFAYAEKMRYQVNSPLRIFENAMDLGLLDRFCCDAILEVLARVIPKSERRDELYQIALSIFDFSIHEAYFNTLFFKENTIDFHRSGYGFTYFTLRKLFSDSQRLTNTYEIIHGNSEKRLHYKNTLSPLKEAIRQFGQDMEMLGYNVDIKNNRDNRGKSIICITPNRFHQARRSNIGHTPDDIVSASTDLHPCDIFKCRLKQFLTTKIKKVKEKSSEQAGAHPKLNIWDERRREQEKNQPAALPNQQSNVITGHHDDQQPLLTVPDTLEIQAKTKVMPAKNKEQSLHLHIPTIASKKTQNVWEMRKYAFEKQNKITSVEQRQVVTPEPDISSPKKTVPWGLEAKPFFLKRSQSPSGVIGHQSNKNKSKLGNS